MIRVVFTRAPGIISGFIRWITASKVSHCGIQLADDSFLGADSGGVKLRNKTDFLVGNRRIVSVYEMSAGLEDKVDRAKLLSFQGDGYDYDGVIYDLIPTLSWRWFKVRLGNPLADKDEFFCSQFVVVALRTALGPDFTPPELAALDSGTVTPSGLEGAIARGRTFSRVVAANPC